ncbi:MAG: YidB family protein, partial [Candidatus Limnocylindrales bacterium]
SWIGSGASQAITPAQVEQVLGSSQLSQIAAQSGLPPDQLKSNIASILPHLVSSLSPNGSVPEPAQVQTMVGQIQAALGGLAGQH